MTSRVSPSGSIQSPASMPANAGRSACATWPTVTPSDPASARSMLDLELGLLALASTGRRRPRRAPCAPRAAISSASCGSSRESRPVSCELDLLLIAEAAGRDRRRRRPPACRARRAASAATSSWLARALVLRLQPHVDGALVDRPGLAADGRVACRRPRGATARCATTSCGLQLRVREVRARRRVERDVELRVVRSPGRSRRRRARSPAARARRRTTPIASTTIASGGAAPSRSPPCSGRPAGRTTR